MNLEFFIRLREMVSSGLVKMAQTANKTSASIKGVNGTLAQSYDTIRTKIAQLESAIAKSTSVNHIREARRELEQLQRIAAKAPGNTAGGQGGFFAGGLRSLLPAIGIAGALSLGGSVVGAGFDAQARQVSFEVMAGRQQGTALNRDLTKYAQDSIYGNEVYQNAQTMMAFGIAPEKVMGDMKMLGDIAMGNKDRFGRLALAYSQVAAAGKLMGQDLLQFVNAGFNPLQIISEKTGVSMGELREKMSAGLITFEQVKAAFESATGEGGKFFEMTKRIEQTDFGKWEAFKGQVQGIAMQIGGALAPAMGTLITVMSESIKWIQENWSWLGMLVTVGGAAVIAYQAVAAATWLWTAAQTALNVAMSLNPIGLVIAGIAAVVGAIVWAWNTFEGFRNVVGGVWEVLKVVGSYLKIFFTPLIAYLTLQFEVWRFVITKLWDAFKWVFDKVGEYFMIVFQPIIDAIKWLWNAAGAALGNSTFGKDIAAAWSKGSGSATKEASAVSPTSVMGGGNGLSGVFDSLKNGNGSTEDGGATRGITGGGPRVINVNIGKMVETVTVNALSVDEGLKGLEDKIEEHFLRILNSGAAIQ